MGFLRKTRFIWEKPTLARADKDRFSDKPTLSERNPHYLQRNLLSVGETHIIWSDNVSFLDKPTLSADNGSFFQKNLVYQTEKPTLSEIDPLYLIIVTTVCHTWPVHDIFLQFAWVLVSTKPIIFYSKDFEDFIDFGYGNAGITLTGYHPPRAPQGFCTKMCAQP